MRKACCSAVRGGNVKRAATLVESPGNRFSDAGSIPAISTKQVLDEHLFLQRRLRREMFALIHNRKAPSWESDPEAALFCYPHIRFPLILLLQWLQKGTGGYTNGKICHG